MPGHESGPNPKRGDPSWISSTWLLLLGLLLLGCIDNVAGHPHKWNVLEKGFRFMQETMLRNSLERAHLNYGIVFECRTM